MKEHLEGFLNFVERLEIKVKLAFIFLIAFGGLLLADKYRWQGIDLGEILRLPAWIFVFLSGAVILVFLISKIALLIWTGWKAMRTYFIRRRAREAAVRLEARAKELAQLDKVRQEAEAENAARDRMLRLNRWVSQLPETPLRYLASIWKYKEDELWANPNDPWIETLVEREFLDRDPKKYAHGTRYIVPSSTKAILASRAEGFKQARDIERHPWSKYHRSIY